MKKIINSTLLLLLLSSCYETKINPNALLFERDSQSIEIPISSASVSGNNYYFGLNLTESLTIESTTAVPMPYSGCITSYEIESFSSTLGAMNSVYLNINETTASTSLISSSNLPSGTIVSNTATIHIGATDRLRVEFEGAAMGGTIDAVARISFGPCNQ